VDRAAEADAVLAMVAAVADPSDAAVFRHVLGHFPTGVTAVTAHHEGKPVGMAVGSFASVSLDPPLVIWMCGRESNTWPAIAASGRFCVNVMTTAQQQVCAVMASKVEDKFDGISWRPSPATGSPIIEGSLAWIDCEIEAVHDGGDHHIVLGRVIELEIDESEADPLLFHKGSYGGFSG